MSAVRKPVYLDYKSYVHDRSQCLPQWDLKPADIELEQWELALILAEHGGGEFVQNALAEKCEQLACDGYDTLAIRATADDLNQAVIGCGLAVFAAVKAYAVDMLLRDIASDRDGLPYYLIEKARLRV
jgi:hypothetical protein